MSITEEELRMAFCRKLFVENVLFKRQMLGKDKEDIMASAYQIDRIFTLYEILVEEAESMDVDVIAYLIGKPEFLRSLYEKWMKTMDESYTEYKSFVLSEIGRMVNV